MKPANRARLQGWIGKLFGCCKLEAFLNGLRVSFLVKGDVCMETMCS